MILKKIIIKIDNYDPLEFFDFKKQLLEILKVHNNIEFIGYIDSFKVVKIEGINYKITCCRELTLTETKSKRIKLLPSKKKYYKEYFRIIEEYKT
jgi:hypothetical protein